MLERRLPEKRRARRWFWPSVLSISMGLVSTACSSSPSSGESTSSTQAAKAPPTTPPSTEPAPSTSPYEALVNTEYEELYGTFKKFQSLPNIAWLNNSGKQQTAVTLPDGVKIFLQIETLKSYIGPVSGITASDLGSFAIALYPAGTDLYNTNATPIINITSSVVPPESPIKGVEQPYAAEFIDHEQQPVYDQIADGDEILTGGTPYVFSGIVPSEHPSSSVFSTCGALATFARLETDTYKLVVAASTDTNLPEGFVYPSLAELNHDDSCAPTAA